MHHAMSQDFNRFRYQYSLLELEVVQSVALYVEKFMDSAQKWMLTEKGSESP